MERPRTERTLTIDEVMHFAGPWILAMAVATFGPYFVIHGFAWPSSAGLFFARLFVFIVVYLLSVVVHELLHVVGMLMFGRVPLSSISFGHRLSEGVVYVHSNEAMTARAYRGVLLLPGVITGVLPAVWGIAVGSGWITFYGWVMMASAVGDLAVYRLMSDLPSSTRVQDHPKEVGLLIEK
ncbi:MAG: metalloprotease family protein [Bacteroidota bacterium]